MWLTELYDDCMSRYRSFSFLFSKKTFSPNFARYSLRSGFIIPVRRLSRWDIHRHYWLQRIESALGVLRWIPGTGYSDLVIEELEECEIIKTFASPGQNTQLIGIETFLSFRHSVERQVNRGSMNVTCCWSRSKITENNLRLARRRRNDAIDFKVLT